MKTSARHRLSAPTMGLMAATAFSLLARSTAPATAGEICAAPRDADAVLATIDAQQRLAWIDAHLVTTAHRARLWTWGWSAGLGLATAANLAPLAFVSADQRIDWYVGAGTTVIGIVPLLIAPLDVVADATQLRRAIAQRLPQDGTCALLADAEGRLARDAGNQIDGRRWWLHVGNVLLNSGVGLFLGLGFHHWGAGALNAVSGSLIGEAIILTQPTTSIADFAAYRAGKVFTVSPPVGYQAAF
ncbi:MAG TPA: hypothetical protein VH374_05565 [Polyangia bacterium]|jgi:hypothetical protein|nr:hypothetical protein [Polyangia bacterium]